MLYVVMLLTGETKRKAQRW